MDKNFEEAVLRALNELQDQGRQQGQRLSALDKRFDALQQGSESLGKRIDEQGNQLRKLEAQTGQIERGMDAIRTLPVPYGRPKTFVSATEMHSVSNPVTAKQGYQG